MMRFIVLPNKMVIAKMIKATITPTTSQIIILPISVVAEGLYGAFISNRAG